MLKDLLSYPGFWARVCVFCSFVFEAKQANHRAGAAKEDYQFGFRFVRLMSVCEVITTIARKYFSYAVGVDSCTSLLR